MSSLDPEAALALEVANQAFVEEEGFVAAYRSDTVFKSVFEGDDEVVVDGVFAIYVNWYHGSVGGEPEITFAATFDEEEAFAGKESLHEALELGFNFNAHGGTDKCGVL